MARVGDSRGAYRVSVGRPDRKRTFGYIKLDGRIILKWLCRKWNWVIFG